ncbi:hypothetical protein B0T16DRAFT_423777 [Cercophora newfieldiana]|uniref:Uncharacterized protein n=1 Tax=Cercophora newfieldiana TaxID=92897 RepID=A0AA39XTH0_9PEZI|nr:hypothetical protein B0T16DRAFT_423777 [Cercophora newfieldiana]
MGVCSRGCACGCRQEPPGCIRQRGELVFFVVWRSHHGCHDTLPRHVVVLHPAARARVRQTRC